jgi:hypothetical protein
VATCQKHCGFWRYCLGMWCLIMSICYEQQEGILGLI